VAGRGMIGWTWRIVTDRNKIKEKETPREKGRSPRERGESGHAAVRSEQAVCGGLYVGARAKRDRRLGSERISPTPRAGHDLFALQDLRGTKPGVNFGSSQRRSDHLYASDVSSPRADLT
jgi:hypothetical protein